MLFTQIEFFILIVLLLSGLIFLKRNESRKTMILLASYYFYAFWDYRFLGFIIVSTVLDFGVGIGLKQTKNAIKRKLLLILSLVGNLCILTFFKYYNFFIVSFRELFAPFDMDLQTIQIILPVGISFYIFKTLTYTIDVYRNKINVCESLLDYALFVGFFPCLLAGPIVRAADFLPQLKRSSIISTANLQEGFCLFVVGLFKKVFIADRLALFINPVFNNYKIYDTRTLWLAVLGYTIQIYLDFAGYSDMAIGVSRMMGYEIKINFNWPYLSQNISDFWRRWHISLSTWIKDYLYVPLGGNRKGRVRTNLNLLVAMTLCGLWHGASWTFVLWGAYHGFLLVCHRLYRNRGWTKVQKATGSWQTGIISRLFTLAVIILGWIFFRSESCSQAFSIISRMLMPVAGIAWYHPFVLFVIAVVSIIHVMQMIKPLSLFHLPVSAWYTPTVLFSMVWLVIIFYPKEFLPFIYFQF